MESPRPSSAAPADLNDSLSPSLEEQDELIDAPAATKGAAFRTQGPSRSRREQLGHAAQEMEPLAWWEKAWMAVGVFGLFTLVVNAFHLSTDRGGATAAT